MKHFVLASQSPARLKILVSAGFSPVVMASGLDEDALVATHKPKNSHDLVQLLAQAKAEFVAQSVTEPALIFGGDSALLFAGEILGKPKTAENAKSRWQSMRGKTGELFSGHCLIDSETGKTVSKVSSTKVWFSDIDDATIDAYVSSTEPLEVAGAFTIDSLGGAFIDRIEGDYHTVVGLSLVTLRELIEQLGYRYTDFWNWNMPTNQGSNQ